MNEHIAANPGKFIAETIEITDTLGVFSSLNPEHVDTVDISKPVILAEIAPGRFNLIDSHHRVEKARKMGAGTIKAYRLGPDQHMRFLTEAKGYTAYVEYWNEKLGRRRLGLGTRCTPEFNLRQVGVLNGVFERINGIG